MNLISAWQQTKSWQERTPGALLCLVFGIVLTCGYFVSERSFPSEADLAETTGRVLWVKPYRSSLYFGLSGSPSRFVQYSKGDSTGEMRAAIRQSVGNEVTIKYLVGEGSEPTFLEGTYQPVYGVRVAGSDIKSLVEVHGSYHSDNLIALLLGVPFALLGVTRLVWLTCRQTDG